ncbi:uncharacterized protein BO88DRAFT_447381 [Aspergillus vadensis CBS 113365]|uniref:Letm1 RBD domain-containing protein n=1 Tax=Aspergillus vadensis (strain CBS 113365 / IMI 142717 / IBT 24658) TaxID=1448311 RepID=A0A319AUF5_ASPVC|nr:hypothetical protein BO88DRAFT_447381 [Aspergillus vadensis CBS 113365]PYH63889.1 hypothetical protein BO88DRAFT_447381 [Aspergillus vadensis CBS 113365]
MPSALHSPRVLLNCPHPQLTTTTIASRLIHHQHHHHNHTLLSTRSYASHSKSNTNTKSHTRPSSAAEPTTTTPSTSTSTTILTTLNPPPSTRPASLALPPTPDPNTPLPPSDKLKRYITIGRAYLTFYKTGLKNVYHNYRAAIPLRRTLNLSPYIPSSIPPPSPPATKDDATPFYKTLQTKDLHRSHFQLLRRSAHDIRRMIPFSLILIICGELTPLAVLALGNAITPLTCRIPRQLEKEREKRARAKREALVVGTGSVTPPGVGSAEEMGVLKRMVSREWIEGAGPGEVMRACAVLGLARSYERPGWLVGVVYRGRLRRYAEYLACDDELIRRGGGVAGMEAEEVRIAVEERGGVGVGVGGVREGWEAEREERRWLERWIAGN